MKCNKLFVLTWFLLLAIQVLNKYIFIAEYYLHKDFYVQNCENKQNPQMHCEGKCQLYKKIQKNEGKQNQQETIVNYYKDFFFFCQLQRIELIKVFKEETEKKSSFYISSSIKNYSLEIFHPPCLPS